MDRVFLDANVLFSAAYRDDSGLARLWRLRDVQLITSEYAVEEARRNLPSEEERTRLDQLLVDVYLLAEGPGPPLPPEILLPDKDRPILSAAIRARATHLLTGDTRHFGRYFGKTIGRVRIATPAAYLRER